MAITIISITIIITITIITIISITIIITITIITIISNYYMSIIF